MTSKPALFRIKKEIEMLLNNPSPGVSAWMKGDDITQIEALIIGPDDSPYEKGSYSLSKLKLKCY